MDINIYFRDELKGRISIDKNIVKVDGDSEVKGIVNYYEEISKGDLASTLLSRVNGQWHCSRVDDSMDYSRAKVVDDSL